MISKHLARMGVVAAALIFAGCSSTGMRDDQAAAGADVVESGSGAQTAGAAATARWTGSPLDDPASLLSTRMIYFDFDRSEIRSEYVDVLRAHAAYLVDNPSVTVMVEGHGDERGSREYNIGLGERRANTVLRFFEAEGVNPAQINSISYGEERPADFGHTEASWSMNRRAVLAY